jgi:peroxiredoxin-like protein
MNMENEHTYRVVAWWSAGKTGLAKSDSAPNALHFTAPTQFGGLEGRWTPEDLLLVAVASCYTTTFRAMADYSKFAYIDLEVEVQGTIVKAEHGYAFNRITIHPTLRIASEEEKPRGARLMEKAKGLCLVSRALSVTQIFEPQIQVTVPHTEVSGPVPVG